MTQPAEELVDKFHKLSLEISSKEPERPRADCELKSLLKDISKLDLVTITEIGPKIALIINHLTNPQTIIYDTEISNIIGVLTALVETPVLKPHSQVVIKNDPFWTQVVAPSLAEIYSFFHKVVFVHCNKKLSDAASAKSPTSEPAASSTGGFAHHQLLGLLQKGTRGLLIFLKRCVLTPKAWQNDPKVIESLGDIGLVLCDLMQHPVDIGLDIRSNIGIALAYILFHKFWGDKATVLNIFEQIFSSKEDKEIFEDDKLVRKMLNFSGKDINRIGMGIGIVASWNFEDLSVDYSKLMYLIGENILAIDNGTKEATNLGSARVLEMWTESLTHQYVPLETLEKIRPLFLPLEFFVFSYIPGHIDAVKSCCKNLLGFLTKIYDRMDSINNSGGRLIEDLIRKLLPKPAHIRWMALACVTRNSPASVVVLKLTKDLPTSLLCAERALKSSASESYLCLMGYEFSSLPLAEWEERWISPLFVTQSNQGNDSNWPQKKNIILAILKSDKRQMLTTPVLDFVIRKMNSNSQRKCKVDEAEGCTESALLAVGAIKIASELGLKVELGKNCCEEDSFRGLVPRSVFHSWLCNENSMIRLAAFSLLCETRKSSELIAKDEFESVKILFQYSLVSQNSGFRQQFVAYLKKFLRRVKDSKNHLRRQKDFENLKYYDEFYPWIWNYLTTEGLFVGANFARRCQALDCLATLVAIVDDLSVCGVKPEGSNMKYLRWLTDSYEINKIRALAILEKVPLPSFEDDATCEALFDEAMALCQSLRPPDSVTGQYLLVLLMKKSLALNKEKFSAWNILQSLLQKLEETYDKIEKTSLTEVACRSPMYGLIKCIHMVLNSTNDYLKNPVKYRDFSSKLIKVFLKFNEILFPILGNSAPEGFLPDLPDSSEHNTEVVRSMAAQMLLVCSWRSMRDISLLLADMCILFPLEGEDLNMKRSPESSNLKENMLLKMTSKHILTVEQILTIGDHLLYLMKNLMHRGVFEQVFVGFKILATRLWRSANPELNSLPEKWLKEAMNEEHMSSKCITRRSGGLPYIFQALLSAESHNEAFVSKWVKKLFITDESPENWSIRIHSMNVLRGLIRDTNFSAAIMSFVPDGFRIAFKGLKSQNWNERNAGLMLYGAVMKRTFGPKLYFMSAPTFFRKFPQMYDFLLGELDTCLMILRNKGQIKSVADKEGEDPNLNSFDFTFHLLLLLSAFAPVGQVEDEHFRLGEFISRLQECAANPDMEVRKLAAKAIVPFLINPEDKKKFVLNLLSCLEEHCTGTKVSLNLLHGYLLQITAAIGHISDDSTIVSLIPKLAEILSSGGFFWKIKCPSIYQALAQLLLMINKFEDPGIVNICKNLDKSYEKFFDSRVIAYRNFVPGLPVADEYVWKLKIVCTLNSLESKFELISEVIYEWLAKKETNVIFVEQLLDHLCQSPLLVDRILNNPENYEVEGTILLDCVIRRYLLFESIKYDGQSVLELKYLELLTMVSDKTYSSWLNSSSDTDHKLLVDKLLERLMLICSENSSISEHKAKAFRTFANLLFRTQIPVSTNQQDVLCKMLVEFSYSTVDDDLRLATASSIPEIPFKNLEKFSVINQCKIWLAIILLAQDDEPAVRSIINTKLSKSEKASCDRKSLEKLIEIYFKEVVEPLPLEGLTLLVGLLFRDDYEVKMEDTEDVDEQGRIFERSELNMFMEPVIFAKVVEQYMKTVSPKKSYKEYFEQCLSIDLVDLYELASNSNIFFCTSTLQLIIEIMKKQDDAENNDNEDDEDGIVTNSKKKLCVQTVSEKYLVQNFIRKVVEEVFIC